MTQFLSAEDVPGLLEPGATLFVPGSASEPRALWRAIAERPDCLDGVHVVETRLPGFRDEDYGAFAEVDVEITTFFLPRELHDAHERGQVRFVPMHYRDIWDWLSHGVACDLALVEVTPLDAEGFVSLGLCADFVPAILDSDARVVAELNHALPRLPGAPLVPLERFAFAVESHELPRSAPRSERSEIIERIAGHVVELVPEKACLQTGLGALPDAVLAHLRDRRGLGCHSGMVGDGFLELVRSGALSGETKSLDAGKMVTGLVYGSEELYDWARSAPGLLLRPVSYTHDPTTLAALDRFVAINSAVEIDLAGQVNAESVGGRQISGTGGAVDFLRGASRSRGGVAVVALPATARGGAVSRIVPRLAASTPTTALRTDVDWVVTEHGAARLRGKTPEERAEALVAVAAPEHRATLEREWRGTGSTDRG